ncbi:PREDICTED: uncharacterized protein DDB_G0283697-like [Tarenaya hassleriana]|uniref:uncharacterized protein DDB_G0283697-like n=1 Tax=Tarenaya hassleriana TaxID=28532 RepID=UPI0008FD2AFE|nr:PREDICTED: uncharacterized protein DDB_G0283697-like [Tarenaya hassleriana]
MVRLLPFECISNLGANGMYKDIEGADPTCPRMCKKSVKANVRWSFNTVIDQIDTKTKGIKSILKKEPTEEALLFDVEDLDGSEDPTVKVWKQYLERNPESVYWKKIHEMEIRSRNSSKKKKKGKSLVDEDEIEDEGREVEEEEQEQEPQQRQQPQQRFIPQQGIQKGAQRVHGVSRKPNSDEGEANDEETEEDDADGEEGEGTEEGETTDESSDKESADKSNEDTDMSVPPVEHEINQPPSAVESSDTQQLKRTKRKLTDGSSKRSPYVETISTGPPVKRTRSQAVGGRGRGRGRGRDRGQGRGRGRGSGRGRSKTVQEDVPEEDDDEEEASEDDIARVRTEKGILLSLSEEKEDVPEEDDDEEEASEDDIARVRTEKGILLSLSEEKHIEEAMYELRLRVINNPVTYIGSNYMGLPENANGCDCGAFAAKYVDAICLGKEQTLCPMICDANISMIREQLATSIFANGQVQKK